MLEYVSGNLFDSPAQTLVNTVNIVGVMGRGVALEFKRRYPDMFKRYAAFCKEKRFEVGMLYLYRTPNKWILNFPTKKHWRNPSTEEYIELGLKKFSATYIEQGITSAAFPQLGCGNGGLEWSVVQPIMEEYLRRISIPVYVYVRPRDVKFLPEHLDRDELNRARRAVGFIEFVTDFLKITGSSPTSPDALLNVEYPTLKVRLDSVDVEVPVEDLEDVWNTLRLRGTIDVRDLPSALRLNVRPLIKTMAKLDYIKPVMLADAEGREWQGVQFSPSAVAARPGMWSPEVADESEPA